MFSPPLGAQLAVRGGGSRGDHAVAEIDAPAPVEQLADFDALVAVAATARPGRDVQHHARQVDRVVVQHGGLVAEAAHTVEINTPAQRAPRGGGVLRRNGEAPVVHGSVALEDRVRLRARARAGEPELRVVAASVPQEHQPGLRLAIAPAPMLRGPPPDGRHAARTQHAAHRPHGDPQRGLLLGELLREVRVVEVAILRPPQTQDPRPHRCPELVYRYLPSVTVAQPRPAGALYRPSNAADLPHREA